MYLAIIGAVGGGGEKLSSITLGDSHSGPYVL